MTSNSNFKAEWIAMTARDIAADLWKLRLDAAGSDENVDAQIEYLAERLLDSGNASIMADGIVRVDISVHWQSRRFGEEYTSVELSVSSANYYSPDALRDGLNWLAKVQTVVDRIALRIQTYPRKAD